MPRIGKKDGDGKKKHCMYSAQGDLVCGKADVKQRYDGGIHADVAGFGQKEVVQKARMGVGWVDPYNLNTSIRHLSGEKKFGKEKLPEDDGNNDEKKPCCRCDCHKVGPCKNPAAVKRSPKALCVMCQTGMCRYKC